MVLGIFISIVIPPLFIHKFSFFLQITFTVLSILIYTVFTWRGIRKSLIFLQHTMKKISKTDPTLTANDHDVINTLTELKSFDVKKLVQFTNTLLLNQQTLLKSALSDRDFIDKNKKLRDSVIDLNQLIVTGEEITTLLQHLLTTAVDIIEDCDAGIILQVTNNENILKPAAYIGYKMEYLDQTDFNLQDTYLYQLGKLNEPKPLLVRDRKKIDKKYHSPGELAKYEKAGFYEYNTVLTAPVIVAEKFYGIVSLSSRTKRGFTRDDLQLMEYFTSEMGVVIKNSLLIQKALFLSKHDSLTNVHNRHFFEDVTNLVIYDAKRYKRSIHIVLFDLDNFKEINDTYGHTAGDLVLQTFAKTVSTSIRESDIFARFGGDEFIALFRTDNKTELEKRISTIIKKLETTPVTLKSTKYYIKYSFGIAGFPEDGQNYDELLQVADKNMYRHKAENKKDSEEKTA